MDRPQFLHMSNQAQAVLDADRLVPREDKLAVYEALSRSSIPEEYGELSDEELTAIAANRNLISVIPHLTTLRGPNSKSSLMFHS
jgi:hypothetical protein